MESHLIIRKTLYFVLNHNFEHILSIIEGKVDKDKFEHFQRKIATENAINKRKVQRGGNPKSNMDEIVEFIMSVDEETQKEFFDFILKR